MEKIKYYGAVDLENPVDGYCWNRTACPEKIVTVQERCGKNIEFLRFNGIFSGEEPDGIREKWTNFLDFLVKGITEHIYEYCGADKDEVTACLGMVCVVSCRTGAACRNMIRDILKDMEVGQIRFITKEIAALMYMHKVQGIAGHADGIYLLLDAGERQATVSIVQVQDKKTEILHYISHEECGAMALDSTLLRWLKKIFDNKFQKMKMNRRAFGTLLENWIDGRLFMKSGSHINLNIGDLNSGNLTASSSGKAGVPVKIISNGYANMLSLSAGQIGMFGAEAFEKVQRLWEEGLDMAEKSAAKAAVIINGCYLNFPPLRDYLRDWEKEHAGACLVQSRAACIQGALAMMQEADGWCFSGILKRTWGIVALDQDGKQRFEILLPGGEELPLGYEKQIFVMPKGNEECVQIHFCSVPAGWRYGDDASLLFCEKSLKVISDNLKFPCRKIQAGIRVSDRLQLYAYDMTSGRRVCDEADPVWERALDCMIETEEERR